ncbi:hypothetical protein DFH28DRAFT_1143825 [Melampsora americana]|nr:hypothetical protein DFH28DRAFT_1143825 [Melampsora americana]
MFGELKPSLYKHTKLALLHIQSQIQAGMRKSLTQEATGSFDNEGKGDDQNDHGSNSNKHDPTAGLFKDPDDSNQESPSGDDMTDFGSIMATLPVDLGNMVNNIVSVSSLMAMMAWLEDLICKETESHVENINTSWAPGFCNLCAQLFIDPSINSFACLLTDCPKGQNNCLERQVLSDLLRKNDNGIQDVFPKEYAGKDGSKGGLLCLILIKLLHNVLPTKPTKGVLASDSPLNLINFCGYMIHKTYPNKKHCSLNALFKNLKPEHVMWFAFLEHSVEFLEAFGQLVLIKDWKIFDGVHLSTQMEHSHMDDLVLPTNGKMLVEVAAPSVVPQFHKSLV